MKTRVDVNARFKKLQIANQVISEILGNSIKLSMSFSGIVYVNGFAIKQWKFARKGSQATYIDLPVGGTCKTAIGQLVRWIWDQPCWGADRWKRTFSLNDKEMKILIDGNYPQKTKCVLCGVENPEISDWWNDPKQSGPCCFGGLCQHHLRAAE